MPDFVPVDFDPFAGAAQPMLVPVEHDPFKQQAKPSLELEKTITGRVLKGIAESVQSAVTLPRDVYQGKVDPTSDEGIKRAYDMAFIGSPINPARALGSKYGAPAIQRQAVPSGQNAAVIAAELGAPLPRGIASESKGAQAVTQAARQLPFVGQQIEERTAATIGKAGEAVEGLAGELGATNRAELGSTMRGALDDVVAQNKSTIDDAYGSVRSLINPKAVVIPENTKRVYNTIFARRVEARQPNPQAGLEQIKNIVDEGINFDGLIRAKSDLASTVDFLAAHAGFSNADKKQLGAAMSADLGDIAAKASLPGVAPQQSLAALRQAEGQASKLIESNKKINSLTANKRDEGLAGRLLSAASEKNGDLQLIAQLKQQLPKEHFDAIAGTALHELGQNPATGAFSLNKFYTNWEKLGTGARAVMFPQHHGKFLDDIAALGKHIKDSERYMNTSGTGRAATLGGLIGAAGTATVAAAMGEFTPLLGLGASVVGGYTLARSLAQPSVAASYARMARAALAYEKAPSVAKRAPLMIASKDALTNLANVNNVSPAEFLRLLQTAPRVPAGDSGPMDADSEGQQPAR